MKKTAPGRRACAGGDAGFTYIGVLLAIALIGTGLAGTGEMWRTTVQREKEAELLFIGEEFRRAIARYYDGTPGTARQLPGSLEDLLRDPRYPTVRRYLRKIYHDPMTGRPEWGLVRSAGNTIAGVHSLATDAPIRRSGFPEQYAAFTEAKSYAEWRFMHDAGEPRGGRGTAAPRNADKRE